MARIIPPSKPFSMPSVWAEREPLSIAISAPDGFLSQLRPIDPEFYEERGRINIADYLKAQDQYLNERLENGKMVFHYTTIPALLGIVRDGALWASDVRQLNDRWEIRYALNQLGAILAADSAFAKNHQPIQAIFGVDRFWQFASCFSKSRDQLSQWRAYGNQIGVAIAFDRDHLDEAATAAGGFLTDWRYVALDEFSSFKAELDGIIQSLKDPSLFNEKGELINMTIQHQLTKQAIEIASSIKHPSFREEQEVRFIGEHGSLKKEIQYRSSERSLVPYATLDLDMRRFGGSKRKRYTNFLGMMEIMVWPQNADGQILDAIELLLRDVGHVPIGRSESPYRT